MERPLLRPGRGGVRAARCAPNCNNRVVVVFEHRFGAKCNRVVGSGNTLGANL